MKLLNRINGKLSVKGTPYTPEEIDQHEDASRIWATIAQCKREAQETGRQLWEQGYWEGKHVKE